MDCDHEGTLQLLPYNNADNAVENPSRESHASGADCTVGTGWGGAERKASGNGTGGSGLGSRHPSHGSGLNTSNGLTYRGSPFNTFGSRTDINTNGARSSNAARSSNSEGLRDIDPPASEGVLGGLYDTIVSAQKAARQWKSRMRRTSSIASIESARRRSMIRKGSDDWGSALGRPSVGGRPSVQLVGYPTSSQHSLRHSQRLSVASNGPLSGAGHTGSGAGSMNGSNDHDHASINNSSSNHRAASSSNHQGNNPGSGNHSACNNMGNDLAFGVCTNELALLFPGETIACETIAEVQDENTTSSAQTGQTGLTPARFPRRSFSRQQSATIHEHSLSPYESAGVHDAGVRGPEHFSSPRPKNGTKPGLPLISSRNSMQGSECRNSTQLPGSSTHGSTLQQLGIPSRNGSFHNTRGILSPRASFHNTRGIHSTIGMPRSFHSRPRSTFHQEEGQHDEKSPHSPKTRHTPPHSPHSSASSGSRSQKMTTPAVAALVFFSVCGGPWGNEQNFMHGPIVGCLSLLFMILFWAMVQCRWTAEMSTLLPYDASISLWAQAAFGPPQPTEKDIREGRLEEFLEHVGSWVENEESDSPKSVGDGVSVGHSSNEDSPRNASKLHFSKNQSGDPRNNKVDSCERPDRRPSLQYSAADDGHHGEGNPDDRCSAEFQDHGSRMSIGDGRDPIRDCDRDDDVREEDGDEEVASSAGSSPFIVNPTPELKKDDRDSPDNELGDGPLVNAASDATHAVVPLICDAIQTPLPVKPTIRRRKISIIERDGISKYSIQVPSRASVGSRVLGSHHLGDSRMSTAKPSASRSTLPGQDLNKGNTTGNYRRPMRPIPQASLPQASRCYWLGDFLSYQMMHWSRVAGWFGGSIYPVILVDGVVDLLGQSPCGKNPDSFVQVWLKNTWYIRRLVRVFICCLQAVPAFFSTELYDRILEIMGVFQMACFALFVLYVFLIFTPLYPLFYGIGNAFGGIVTYVTTIDAEIALGGEGRNPQDYPDFLIGVNNKDGMSGVLHDGGHAKAAGLISTDSENVGGETTSGAATSHHLSGKIPKAAFLTTTAASDAVTTGEKSKVTDMEPVHSADTEHLSPLSSDQTEPMSSLSPRSSQSSSKSKSSKSSKDSSKEPPKLINRYSLLFQSNPAFFASGWAFFRGTRELIFRGYWALSGWDNISTVVEEIHEPHKTMPRALTIACTGVYLQYVLVFGAIVIAAPSVNFLYWGDEDDQASALELLTYVLVGGDFKKVRKIEDDDGTKSDEDGKSDDGDDEEKTVEKPERTSDSILQSQLASICRAGECEPGESTAGNGTPRHTFKKIKEPPTILGGTAGWWGINILILIMSICGNVGVYAAELIGGAFQIKGLVENGTLPAWCSGLGYEHPKYRTPWGGIILHTIICCIVVFSLDLEQLKLFDNCFNVLPDICGLICFLRMRLRYPCRPIEKGDVIFHETEEGKRMALQDDERMALQDEFISQNGEVQSQIGDTKRLGNQLDTELQGTQRNTEQEVLITGVENHGTVDDRVVVTGEPIKQEPESCIRHGEDVVNQPQNNSSERETIRASGAVRASGTAVRGSKAVRGSDVVRGSAMSENIRISHDLIDSTPESEPGSRRWSSTREIPSTQSAAVVCVEDLVEDLSIVAPGRRETVDVIHEEEEGRLRLVEEADENIAGHSSEETYVIVYDSRPYAMPTWQIYILIPVSILIGLSVLYSSVSELFLDGTPYVFIGVVGSGIIIGASKVFWKPLKKCCKKREKSTAPVHHTNVPNGAVLVSEDASFIGQGSILRDSVVQGVPVTTS